MKIPRPADYAAGRSIGLRLGLLGLPAIAINAVVPSPGFFADTSVPDRLGLSPHGREVISTVSFCVWLFLLCLAGFLAARRTGFVQPAVVSGCIAGMLDGAFVPVSFLLLDVLLYSVLRWPQPPVYTRGTVSADSPLSFRALLSGCAECAVFFGLLYGLIGTLCGLFGGALGLLFLRLRRWQHATICDNMARRMKHYHFMQSRPPLRLNILPPPRE